MQMLVAALVASLCICCAVALQCKQCMQFKFDTDNDDAKQALQGFSAMSNEKCANRAGELNEAGLETTMCPAAPPGLKAVCMTMSVGATFKVPNHDISVAIMQYQRACHVVPAGEAATGECKDLDKKLLDDIKKSMGEMEDSYSDMSGKVCNCEGDDCNTEKAPSVVLAAGASQNVAVLSASLLMCLVHLLF